jgi:hypothetical protein
MPLRFYRRVRIMPGLTLNLSKGGVSTSVGGRGAHITVGTKGSRATVGLPGTGLSWTEKLGARANDKRARGSGSNWLGWAILIVAVIMFLGHYAH